MVDPARDAPSPVEAVIRLDSNEVAAKLIDGKVTVVIKT